MIPPERVVPAAQHLEVVTGAFGYTGKYITRRLLGMGRRVKTLTGHPDRMNPFGRQVSAEPLCFDDPGRLAESLKGARTLYNTYWVRFARRRVTFEAAVENSGKLVQACREAGVARIVHVSITNVSVDSSLPYFRGKGIVERLVIDSGLSYAILRPTVIFGAEDILINNMAWLLRRFPIFALPGSGDYRLQPVFVEDLAELAVRAAEASNNLIQDAVGPEIYTFEQLVRRIAETIHSRAKLVHLPPWLALSLSRSIGWMVRDVVLTRDEVEGLMANLLVSQGPPTGQTRLSEWLARNAGTVGRNYASEINRHFR